jgi:hypothetical protein
MDIADQYPMKVLYSQGIMHKAPCGRTRRGDICDPVRVPI